jgi:hypothetical protein
MNSEQSAMNDCVGGGSTFKVEMGDLIEMQLKV